MREDPGHIEKAYGGVAVADPEVDVARNASMSPPQPDIAQQEASSACNASKTTRRTQRTGSHRYRPQRAAVHLTDRTARWRVIVWSLVGVTFLLAAHQLKPGETMLISLPSDPVAWVSTVFGVLGIWLVPGVWISGVMVRTGAGLPAWLGTRIGTTLAWYAWVGPAIHFFGQGAWVTTNGILIATISATAAAVLGIALGLAPWPRRLGWSILISAVVGAVCAQVVIWLSMRIWSYGMNYAHIRRLDWLIVLVCATVVSIGTVSTPKLPPIRTFENLRMVFVSMAILTVTTAALVVTNVEWSPQQRMPSAFSIEQVPAPPGAGLAFSLTAIGPDGHQLIQRADFSITDDTGHAVPADARLLVDGSADHATLHVDLQEGSHAVLCQPPGVGGLLDAGLTPQRPTVRTPLKVNVHDAVSGVRVQAAMPDGWCGP